MSVDLRLKVSQWGRLQLLCGWCGVCCRVYMCGWCWVCLFELWFMCVCVSPFFFSQSDRVFRLDRMKPDPITIWSGWQYCIRSDIAFNSIWSEPDFFFIGSNILPTLNEKDMTFLPPVICHFKRFTYSWKMKIFNLCCEVAVPFAFKHLYF